MGLPPASSGSALISTPLSIRSASRPGSTNAGSVVAKAVTGRGSGGFVDQMPPVFDRFWPEPVSATRGYVTGFANRPVRLSPRLKIRWTFPFVTSCLNSV
jgi:hypothetical protein